MALRVGPGTPLSTCPRHRNESFKSFFFVKKVTKESEPTIAKKTEGWFKNSFQLRAVNSGGDLGTLVHRVVNITDKSLCLTV